jgi:hypothetical protein
MQKKSKSETLRAATLTVEQRSVASLATQSSRAKSPQFTSTRKPCNFGTGRCCSS